MVAWIEQKKFHVQDADDLVGGVGVNRNAMMATLPQLRDRFFVGQVVRQRKRIDPRGHAILRGFVAEFDDLLDHFAFGFLKGALFFANLDESLELLVAELFSLAQMQWSQPFDNCRAGPLEQAADAIEQGHGGLEGENSERG